MATVDILMATYNGERFVREQIESIQAQSYGDWRLLVSDDCSSDGTVNIVHDMAKTDPRIILISEGERHGSAKANFMSLLSKSEAPYVMFCDQDDVWLPEKAELTIDCMRELESRESTAKPLLIFTDMKVVDVELNIINESFEKFSHIDPYRTKFPQLVAQSAGAGCTMMANRRAIGLACAVQNIEPMVMHDWWLSLVCSAFGAIAYVDTPTSLYRQHGDNEVGAKSYRPLERVFHFEDMRKSVAASAAQAAAFRKTYTDMFDPQQAQILDDFVTACNSKGADALFHLTKSRCWKKGLRKLGQITVCLSEK